MGSEGPDNEYLIIRPEKIRVIDIISIILFRKSLRSCGFVESSGGGDGDGKAGAGDGGRIRADWVTPLVVLILKVLETIKTPMKWTGIVVEFILNLFALNGGILSIIWKTITGRLKIPKRDAANFRSMIAMIDGRLDLYKNKSLINFFPLMEPRQAALDDINVLDLSMMAAKISYENPAYIEDAVTSHWKMHFVGFFDCWNKFLSEKTTQAFICTNKAEDADLIVVAFRGTEPFNAKDWATDVDLSTILAGKLGLLHLGFLKALGLQDEKNFLFGFPKEFNSTPDKPIAYYAIRKALRDLLAKHKNAKILVTGHSLGGALAALFPALLSYHNQGDILSAMYGVMTFGQPRVGDAIFKTYVELMMRSVRYQRMVYRYDIVPRIPFDVTPVSNFKHCGLCVYYDGWYKAKDVDEVPNPNYFDPLLTPQMYLAAWTDLFKASFLGWTEGKDFKDGIVSLLYRFVGLALPGISFHSPRDYVNAGRLSKKEANKALLV